jgi:hypothetical protein
MAWLGIARIRGLVNPLRDSVSAAGPRGLGVSCIGHLVQADSAQRRLDIPRKKLIYSLHCDRYIRRLPSYTVP